MGWNLLSCLLSQFLSTNSSRIFYRVNHPPCFEGKGVRLSCSRHMLYLPSFKRFGSKEHNSSRGWELRECVMESTFLPPSKFFVKKKSYKFPMSLIVRYGSFSFGCIRRRVVTLVLHPSALSDMVRVLDGKEHKASKGLRWNGIYFLAWFHRQCISKFDMSLIMMKNFSSEMQVD